MRSEHVSVVIGRPPAEVSAFAAEPANLPRWAAGLAAGELRQEGEWLVADSPRGRVRVPALPVVVRRTQPHTDRQIVSVVAW